LKIDPKLIEFATVRQIELIEALEKYGSSRKAAAALGIAKSTVNAAMLSLRDRAAKQGYSPAHDMTRAVPDGFIAGRISTNYKEDGSIGQQWVIATPDKARQEEMMRAAYDAMASELPRQKPIKMLSTGDDNLVNLFTLTDSHVGALCWDKENLDANGNWDLKIAERVLTGCFQHMVDSSPPAKLGIVAQLGDYLNQDGINALTPLSGHLLNADGRFPKIVDVAVRILRRVVNMALEKHEKVVVLIAEGNHDISSSIWLRAMFAALYEDEPRVEIINSALPYYVYQHGQTMLAWHHGHLKKNSDLPMLFASQFPKIWGDTVKRIAHCGHRHHVEIKEHSGMTVHQHSTLVARDAYAARGGWMSERQATALTYHKDFGLVASVTSTPEMLGI
jgi:hypothetical protein